MTEQDAKRDFLKQTMRSMVWHAYTLGRLDQMANQRASQMELDEKMGYENILNYCFPKEEKD